MLNDKQKDMVKLSKALSHVQALTKVDLDRLLRLSWGANNEVNMLHYRICEQIRILSEELHSVRKDEN